MSRIALRVGATALTATVALGFQVVSAAAKPSVELVSRAPSGEKANAGSYEPGVSRDGRFVAFVSDATNLRPDYADAILEGAPTELRAPRVV